MSILFIDGFDHYGNVGNLSDGVYASALNLALNANTGPGGVGTSLRCNADGYLRKVLPGARTIVGVGQRIFFPDLPLANAYAAILSFNNGANARLVRFFVQSTGAIACFYGNDNDNNVDPAHRTPIFITDPVITANSWQFVEIKVDFTGGNLKVTIGINSITIFEQDNLMAIGGPYTAQVAMLETLNGGVFWRIRDLYIWDNLGTLNNAGMQGDRQVITSFPTSDGPLQDWLPSAGGVGYAMIDEVPPVDTDYVSANNAADFSNYGFTDIDTDVTNISCVQVVGRMKKSDAGVGSFKFGLLSGADLIEGAEKGLTTEWTYYWSVFETDPTTDLKWTPLGVNDALVELDRIS